MIDNFRSLRKAPKIVGIAADHGGFALKGKITGNLRLAGFTVKDFGARTRVAGDDFPDFVVPLARAVAEGKVDRGIAICGSGVGASVIANKVPGVRASLIHETFSARQGVEDDAINVICLGGRVIGYEFAWELVKTFLAARFTDVERFRRRLSRVSELEKEES